MSGFARLCVSALLLATLVSAGPAAGQVGNRQSMGNLGVGAGQSMGNFFVPMAPPVFVPRIPPGRPVGRPGVPGAFTPNPAFFPPGANQPDPRSLRRRAAGNLSPRDPRAIPAIQGPQFWVPLEAEAAVRRAQERRGSANLRPQDPRAVAAIQGSERVALWPPPGPDPATGQPPPTPIGVRNQEAFRQRSAGNQPPGDPAAVPAIEGSGRLPRETVAGVQRAVEGRSNANLRLEDPTALPAVFGSDRTAVVPAPEPVPEPALQPAPVPEPALQPVPVPQAPEASPPSVPQPVPRSERPEQWQFHGKYRLWYDPPTGVYYRYVPQDRQFVPVAAVRGR